MIDKMNEFVKLTKDIKNQKEILKNSIKVDSKISIDADNYAINHMELQLSKLAVEIVNNFLNISTIK